MEDDLPTEYDVIVVGTGMTESIVAAAASRIGKKVLHLDSNEYYGGLWASFNFDGLQKWLEECKSTKTVDAAKKTENISTNLNEGEKLIPAGSQFASVFNIQEKWYILEEAAESADKQVPCQRTQTEEGPGEEKAAGEAAEAVVVSQSKSWNQARLKKEYRKFNLDLAPKLLFARGSLVELLISSNIARYAEFRSVTRVLTWLNGRLEPVPCTRADVFATTQVTAVEKRLLMKLLTACMEHENNEKEFEEFADKPFVEYLKSKELTGNLYHYVLYAIAMSTEKTPCMVGVARAKRFLNSLGRYGNTPFLWPMYGSGELPQCFCRLCAVFGGLYHLKRAANALVVNTAENKCLGIVSGTRRLETAHLVMGLGYAPAEFLKGTPSGGMSRGIFVTDRSIHPADKETLTLLQFPPAGNITEPVTVIEIGPSTNACPPGLYIVHMTCKQTKNAYEDLLPVVNQLLHAEFDDGVTARIDTDTQATQTDGSTGEETSKSEGKSGVRLKPQVLWSLYFNCPETSDCDLSASVPSNVFLCSGPDLELDFEYAVHQAKEIFTKMYPDAEFLPRAPDPEEIILEGEDGPAESMLQSDEKDQQGGAGGEE